MLPASAYNVSTDISQPSINAMHPAQHQRPSRPLCTHCGLSSHTVDKCYKVHGYPPGFKSKRAIHADKQPLQMPAKPVVANISLTDNHTNDFTATSSMTTLTKDQIQGVIEYFSAQMQLSQSPVDIPSTSGGTITTLPGMAFSTKTLCFTGILRTTGHVLSSESWIIDSGVTHHVCYDRSLFSTVSDIQNRTVSVPTGLGVQIVGIGQVQLNEFLILNNVLYIPDFRLNLLSVS